MKAHFIMVELHFIEMYVSKFNFWEIPIKSKTFVDIVNSYF